MLEAPVISNRRHRIQYMSGFLSHNMKLFHLAMCLKVESGFYSCSAQTNFN
jgi:hypothetical protein